MSDIFGFDEAAQDMDVFADKTDRGREAMYEVGDKMVKSAKRDFQAQTTTRTGQGASGIEMDKNTDAVEIGWSSRPRLHAYFHELGTYKDPPKPHMRPAFDEHEEEFIRRVQQVITE